MDGDMIDPAESGITDEELADPQHGVGGPTPKTVSTCTTTTSGRARSMTSPIRCVACRRATSWRGRVGRCRRARGVRRRRRRARRPDATSSRTSRSVCRPTSRTTASGRRPRRTPRPIAPPGASPRRCCRCSTPPRRPTCSHPDEIGPLLNLMLAELRKQGSRRSISRPAVRSRSRRGRGATSRATAASPWWPRCCAAATRGTAARLRPAMVKTKD